MGMYTKHKWESNNHFNFGYIKYLPKDYDETKKYPLVFFLHGAGERGDNLDMIACHGYMQYVKEQGREYPFIFIAPQCPNDKYWGCYTESLLSFLDWICEELPVDKTRVYLTGLSMGGTGTFMLAMAEPERFAAIAPICGSGIRWYAGSLKDVPVYMYHGDCDKVIPISESVTMMRNINLSGGNARLEICYGIEHNAWDIAYSDTRLEEWFLSHVNDRI